MTAISMTSDTELQTFFAAMQQRDAKARLAQLEELQRRCANPVLKQRLPGEIARARRLLTWGKIAEQNPLPPAA